MPAILMEPRWYLIVFLIAIFLVSKMVSVFQNAHGSFIDHLQRNMDSSTVLIDFPVLTL